MTEGTGGDDLVTLETLASPRRARPWKPQRVLFTPAAFAEHWGQQIYERVSGLGLPVEVLKTNRLTGLQGDDERDTYRRAKSTLAVVVAPPGQFKLRPIPPSADYQFHLAEGCPAHCQYCYLAGSLSGPPVVRVYANLPQILQNLTQYEAAPGLPPHSFEASCYTDPLGIEHLTGSLAECIRHFGTREGRAHLRWVSKFDNVEGLLDLPHNGQTRARFSVNAASVSRQFEGGVASVPARLAALRKMALPCAEGGGGYPVGVVIAPIMPLPDWENAYSALFEQIDAALDFPCDLTFELITHRFTPGSRDTLLGWYPKTKLDFDESGRERKINKFGGVKHVYPRDTMRQIRRFFEDGIARRFPAARLLYFT